MKPVRSIIGVVLGILITSVVIESLELALVALALGAPTMDPETYLSVRNQSWFLALKAAYNCAGGAIGGYATARIAGRRPILHSAIAALVQGLTLTIAAFDPVMRLSMPGWAWVTIGVTTLVGLLLGGWVRHWQISGRP